MLLDLQPAGSTWIHSINNNGVCVHCGRTREEIKAGYYQCHRKHGMKPFFTGTAFLKAPRHPLFLDSVREIRDCGYCERSNSGFCKRHNDLRQFLETHDRYLQRTGQKGKK